MGVLLKRYYKKVMTNSTGSLKSCIGCGQDIKSSFYRTGSVLDGLAFTTIDGEDYTPLLGHIISYAEGQPVVYQIGGEVIQVQKRVAFHKRKKGFLCEVCSSNYHSVTHTSKNGEVKRIPIVKVDPLNRIIPETKHFAHETSVSDWKEDGPVHAAAYRSLVMHDKRSSSNGEAPLSNRSSGSFGSRFIGRR